MSIRSSRDANNGKPNTLLLMFCAVVTYISIAISDGHYLPLACPSQTQSWKNPRNCPCFLLKHIVLSFYQFFLLCVTLNLCVCFDHGLFARFCMSVCSQLSGRGGSLGFPPPIISWKSQHAVSWNSYLCLTSKFPKLLPRFRLVSPNCKSPTHLLLYSTSSQIQKGRLPEAVYAKMINMQELR